MEPGLQPWIPAFFGASNSCRDDIVFLVQGLACEHLIAGRQLDLERWRTIRKMGGCGLTLTMCATHFESSFRDHKSHRRHPHGSARPAVSTTRCNLRKQ